jgi:hypothetical protein
MSTPTNYNIPASDKYEVVAQTEQVTQTTVTVRAKFTFLDGTDATIDVPITNPSGSADIKNALDNRYVSELRNRFSLNPDGSEYVEPTDD